LEFQLSEGQSFTQFPSTVVTNKAPVRTPRTGTANPRTDFIIPPAVFQEHAVLLESQVVRWRRSLITAVYSSFEDAFTLFGLTTKQVYCAKTLPNVLQAEVSSLLPNPPYES